MNTSVILEYIANYPSIPLACAIVILLVYVIYLHHKLHRFTKGQTGASLEELIQTCVDSVSEIEKRNELISAHALSLDTRVSQALRNAQTIRYKAFEVGGSSQSFSIALLNEKGNGVVISSLHARDRINTFAKPVEKYASSYELTEEELSVITDAKKAHQKS
jgi:hypothetical protein